MTRVGGNPMARTGAVWMISIWHSSTFNHSWFRFQLLVHLDLCRWFNKQTQYIVHHANCIIKLLTYFQTSSFYSSVPLSFPSFPLFSFISNPRRGFAFFPKPESIKDPIMSEVSPTALQTAHCWRIFPEVVWEITANASPCQRKPGYSPTPGKSPRLLSQLLSFCEGSSKLEFVGVFRITGAQQETSFFPFLLVGRNNHEAGKQLTCTQTLISRLVVVCQHHPQSLRFHPERKTPWDFCKILLSCSNGSSSGSGELLCYRCRANC